MRIHDHHPLLLKALKHVQQVAKQPEGPGRKKRRRSILAKLSPKRLLNTMFFWNRFEGNKRRLFQVIAIGLLVVLTPLIIESLIHVVKTLAAQHGTATSPVVYWKFDEGNGSVANDASGNENAGTITGPTWQLNDLCLSEKCLFFDGSNDFVTRADDSDLDFIASDGMTLSAWIKHGPSTSGTDVLMAKFESTGADGGYKVYMDADGDIVCGIDDDNTSFPEDSAASTTADYDDGVWHHVACVKDGTASLKLYVDGKLIATDSSISSTGTLANDDAFYVGIDGDGVSNPWAGFIDDVKVYRLARSADQIKIDYNAGASVLGAKEQDALSNGLVGYWKMDESSWTNNCSTETVTDSSGNTDNGVSCPNTTGPTGGAAGKFGNAGDFDGSNDYVQVTTSFSDLNQITYSAWIYPETGGQNNLGRILYQATSTIGISFLMDDGFSGDNSIRFEYGYQTLAGLWNSANSVINLNQWNHVVVTFDSTSTNNDPIFYVNGQKVSTTENQAPSGSKPTVNSTLYIGNRSGGDRTFDGKIDETRVYNRILSPGEISQLYNFTPGPVGYWDFEEGTGSTAQDKSGKNHAATLTGSPVWSEGKNGKGVKLDGTSSQYVSVGDHADYDITGAVTMGMWVKPSTMSDTTVDLQVNASGNDGDQNTNGLSGTITRTTTRVGNDSNAKISGYRFTSVTIPQGTTLSSVTFTLTGQTTYNCGACTLTSTIYGEDTDDSAIFTAAGSNISGRTKTSASTAMGSLTSITADQEYSFNTTSAVQEIVNRAGWSSGNALSILVNDSTSSAGEWQDFYAYDGSTTKAAKLSITYAETRTVGGKGIDAYAMQIDSSRNLTGYINTSNTLSEQLSANEWSYVVMTYDGSTQRLYVNGVLTDSAAVSGAINTNATNLTFGQSFDGVIDDVKVYNYARTPSQVIEDMNAGHPIGGSPIASQVGYWKFDEGAENTCAGGTNDICNSGSQGTTLDGTTTSPTRVNTGKVKRAIDFNGTTSVATVANADAIDFDVGLASGSAFTAWINPDNAGEGSGGRIFSKGTNTWLRVDMLSGGRLDIEASLDLETTDATVNVSSAVAVDEWSHVAMAHSDDSDDEIDIYVNGLLVGSSTNGVGRPIIGDTSSLFIGNDSASATQTFDGTIDEFKVYNTGLTADQVKVDLNLGKSIVLGAVGTESDGTTPSFDAERGYCHPGNTTSTCGPTGEWVFDSDSGTTVRDTSGNGINLTATNGPLLQNGYIGKGRKLDGSNDVLQVADNSNLDVTDGEDFTIELWFNRSSTANDAVLVEKKLNASGANAGYSLYQWSSGNGDDLCFYTGDGTDSWETCTSASSIATNRWYHIVAVWDNDSQANSKIYINGVQNEAGTIGTIGSIGDLSNALEFTVGAGNNTGSVSPANGTFDQVRFYKRAFTASDIAWAYNKGKPVAHWKMDENTGTTISDSSGNGNTSSAFTGNTTWITGKRNYGLTFDGTDDVVRVPETTTTDVGATTDSYSIAVWFKVNAPPSVAGSLISKAAVGTDPYPFNSTIDSAGEVCFEAFNGTITAFSFGLCHSNSYDDGNWHHMVGIRDVATDTGYLYIDGILVDSQTDSSTGTLANNADVSFGNCCNASYLLYDFNGDIDDGRIYRYALTSQQIKNVMNEGAIRWGPVTGAP